jgi:hypothetical protein
MSILLRRLLDNSRKLLEQGDAAQADSLCCQVINGALAVKNTALAAEAARLLVVIPDPRTLERINTCRSLANEVVRTQLNPDLETSLALSDLLLELLKDEPALLKGVLETVIFICGNAGLDRMKYLRRLLMMQHWPSGGEPVEGLDRFPQDGPAAASAVLSARGAVLVRGLFDVGVLERVRQAGASHFAEHSVQAILFSEMPMCKEPLSNTTLSFLRAVLAPFFGREPELRDEVSYLRQVAAQLVGSTVPFHQDFNAFGRLNANVWVPLTACGRRAPGLELVAQRIDHIAETVPATDQYHGLEISQALVRERFGNERILAPEMVPGDALILLATTIHRTYVTPDMSETRTSLELRFG